MAETLLFFGTDSNGSASIWLSDSNTFRYISDSPSAAVNNWTTPPDVWTPPPILLCAGNPTTYIYAPAVNGQLLVWDTSHWTSALLGSEELNPQGFAWDGNELVYFNGSVQSGLATLTQDLWSSHGGAVHQITTTGVDPVSLTWGPYLKLFFGGNDPSSGNNVLLAYGGSGQPGPAPGTNGGDPPFNPAYLTCVFNPMPEAPGMSIFMSGQDSTGQNARTCLYLYDYEKPPQNIDPTKNGLQPCNLVWLEDFFDFKILGKPVGGGFGVLFFSGVNDSGKRGLWMSLGSKETTVEIPTPTPAGDWVKENASVYPFNLTPVWAIGPNTTPPVLPRSVLYFTAYDTYVNGFASTRGLFVYDPVENQVIHVIDSGKVQLDPSFEIGWEVPPSEGPVNYNQTTMTFFNDDLYFAALAGTGSESLSNLWKANLNRDSYGHTANPDTVYVEGGEGLQPFSLTTTIL
jgi:hypothetical protein